MKYLVLKNEHYIKFVAFDGPGYQLTIGTFSVNEVVNLLGSSLFTITNFGCNIYVDGKVLPQGISVMEDTQKFEIGSLSMFLIEEDEKSDLEADFYMEMEDQSEEDHWGQPLLPPLQVVDEDGGFCESSEPENWDDDNDVSDG